MYVILLHALCVQKQLLALNTYHLCTCTHVHVYCPFYFECIVTKVGMNKVIWVFRHIVGYETAIVQAQKSNLIAEMNSNN